MKACWFAFVAAWWLGGWSVVASSAAEKAAAKPVVQAAENAPEPGPFQLDIEVYPEKEVMPYDPIYVRLIVTNAGKRAVLTQTTCRHDDGSIGITFINEKTGVSHPYPEPGEPCWDVLIHRRHGGTVLSAGEAYTHYLSFEERFKERLPLCIRPALPAAAPFWRELGDEFRIRAAIAPKCTPLGLPATEPEKPYRTPSVCYEYQQRYGKKLLLTATSPVIRIKPRPAKELKILETVYAALIPPHFMEQPPPPRPRPLIHASSAAMKAYEEQLSPGTYRNGVHFHRLLMLIGEEKDEAKATALVRQLLQWLDSLPEIECHGLTSDLFHECPRIYGAKPSIRLELYYALLDRRPNRYQFKERRTEYLEQGYRVWGDAFLEFMKARGDPKAKELELRMKPSSHAAPALPAVKTPAAEKSPPATTPAGPKK